ncbi:MAG TPA: tRNA (adenosine(37)-N6)-threonylcarbamoyltransferase complex ATPase subunit type 1 TsaE [Planctomycetota bacterium]
MTSVESGSPEETEALGRRIGALCVPGTVIALVGDLGAGKTRFVKGLAAGAGFPDGSKVTSPTFSLMNRYEGRIRLAHFDLYRLDAVDLPSLGFYDALAEGAVVVEWADRAGEALPADHLRISFEVTGEHARRLMIRAGGPKSRGLADALNLSP